MFFEEIKINWERKGIFKTISFNTKSQHNSYVEGGGVYLVFTTLPPIFTPVTTCPFH